MADGVETDDFAIKYRSVDRDLGWQTIEFREDPRQIMPVSTKQREDTILYHGQRADAIPFQFEKIVIGIEWLSMQTRQHRSQPDRKVGLGLGLLAGGHHGIIVA